MIWLTSETPIANPGTSDYVHISTVSTNEKGFITYDANPVFGQVLVDPKPFVIPASSVQYDLYSGNNKLGSLMKLKFTLSFPVKIEEAYQIKLSLSNDFKYLEGGFLCVFKSYNGAQKLEPDVDYTCKTQDNLMTNLIDMEVGGLVAGAKMSFETQVQNPSFYSQTGISFDLISKKTGSIIAAGSSTGPIFTTTLLTMAFHTYELSWGI